MNDSTERRQHPRFAIDLFARLIIADRGFLRCAVRDCSQGGLLIQLTAPARTPSSLADLEVGQKIAVAMRVSVVGGERRLRVGGRIVWKSGDCLGLRFPRSQDTVVEMLRQHQRLQRGGEDRDSASMLPGGTGRALARMRQAAQALLPDLLRELLVAVPERLLHEADKVGSNTEQAQLFADMNSLDGLRESDRLVRAVINQSEAGVNPGAPTHLQKQGSVW